LDDRFSYCGIGKKHLLFQSDIITKGSSLMEGPFVCKGMEACQVKYYDLEQKLIYKALEHGQKVIKVDPKYTSQRCPVCGHTERGNRNKDKHMFCCRHCGYTSNDDRIGAMNICRKGIEYLGSRIPV
jgi:predicted RNA-binding Zn-ribbon protein involved in translation (DUF1610 family)